MQLVFLFGAAASGKLTIARKLAGLTGYPLFHNHLVVDAVAAVFPFGSAPFSQLREEFWMRMFEEAAADGRSLIFTFAPEPSVAADFALRVRSLWEGRGGQIVFVGLEIGRAEQARRLVEASRAEFGKLRDQALLEQLWPQFDACLAAMPAADIVINAEQSTPEESAAAIAAFLSAGDKDRINI